MSFPALKNDRFLRALDRQPVDRTPIWIMRQAGRYLPEYRATRAKAGDFMSLCKATDLACEVTLQPLERYDLDAAILFSDILTIPDAMGLGLYFAEGEGPRFERPISSEADIDKLSADVMSELTYVTDAVTAIRKALDGRVPLIGFSGSPWTLATYMVEGGSSREFKKIKNLVFSEPAAAHRLLNVLADSVFNYLKAQVEAGAQALQIFDTWGGVLPHQTFLDFSLANMQDIVKRLKHDPVCAEIPLILFTKNAAPWLADIAATGTAGMGLDWTADLGKVRALTNDSLCLQGNMDPAILRASDEAIVAEVEKVLNSYGQHSEASGHIFNLGHGITPDVKPESVNVLVDALHSASPKFHS